jgi:hypothetical protein
MGPFPSLVLSPGRTLYDVHISIYRLFPSYIISGFRREADENCALLGHYATSSGNSVPTLRDNLSVPYSRIRIGPIGCPQTSIGNYHYSLRNNSEERSSDLLSSCPFNHLSIRFPRLSYLPPPSFRRLFSPSVTLVPTSHRTPKYSSAVTITGSADAQ